MVPSLQAATVYGHPDDALFHDEETPCSGIDHPLWRDDWSMYDGDPLLPPSEPLDLDLDTPVMMRRRPKHSQELKSQDQYCECFLSNLFIAALVTVWIMLQNYYSSSSNLDFEAVFCQNIQNQTFSEIIDSMANSSSICTEAVSNWDFSMAFFTISEIA